LEHEASPWVFFGMAMFVAAVLALVSILSTRHLRKIPITRMQNLLELSVSALKNYTVSLPTVVLSPPGMMSPSIWSISSGERTAVASTPSCLSIFM
jgi:Na+-transporting NADH:ubiquinone oxidoreductase subunit NqrF